MAVDTGIAPIGDVEWGSHFCHFYRDADDLSETLVPFFKAGLEGNEACLWVTAAPFDRDQAWSALNSHVERLDQRIARGQIEIFSHEEWYHRYGALSPRDVAGAWTDQVTRAAEQGYRGLRLTGNTAFLEADTWDGFLDYELSLREAFSNQRLVALCSYHAEKCDSNAVLDVVQAHDFALARRRGVWEVVESAAVKANKAALAALNAELEQRIGDRTSELAAALAHQKLLTAELSHRVKNSIASVQALVDQTLKSAADLPAARAAIRGRIAALAQVHDRLAEVEWKGVSLHELVKAVLRPYGEQIRLELIDLVLSPRAAMDLSLVLNELATNAIKHGALSASGGTVCVEAERSRKSVRLRWREAGGPQVAVPTRAGFGTKLVRSLIEHNLKGECALEYRKGGLLCEMTLPEAGVAAGSGCRCHAKLH